MKCTRCIAHENNYGINCQPFYGNPDADILFLGELFGHDEISHFKETGISEPFTGAAGSNYRKLLKLTGYKKENVATTNACKCYLEGNATPSKKILDACFIHLAREVASIKPKVLVAMGGSAFYAATGKTDPIEVYRGKLIWSDRLNCKVFVTYHPAAVLYDRKKWYDMVEDFIKIPTLLDSDVAEIKHYKYKLILNREDFLSELPRLKDAEYLYNDTESMGLDPFKDNLTLIQLSDGKEPVLVIHRDVFAYIKNELVEVFKTKPFVGQGWEHDAKFIYTNFDVIPNLWAFDTCLAEYLLTGMGSNDLTSLTRKYVPESFGYDDEVNKVGGSHKVSSEKVLYQYASDDVGVLPKIHSQQRKLLGESNRLWLAENITFPCNKVLTKMSLRGVKYDIDYLNKTDEKYKKKADRALAKIENVPGIEECEKHFGKKFNPRSSQMVKWLIIDFYDLPVLNKSRKTQEPSIGQDEMEIYATKYKNPYCKAMLNYRSIQVVRDNFLSGLLPKLDGDIAHTKYSLHSTNSGRPNSQDPNLLNIPREKDIKRCIVARPGYKFIYSDLAQIEMRVASVMYYDEKLIDICNSGGDFHTRMVVQTPLGMGLSYEDFYAKYKTGDVFITEQRVKGKGVSFGILFQQQAESLSYQLRISVSEAQELIDNYYSSFPGLKKGIDDIKDFVIRNGYVDTYFGFRRWWRNHKEEDHKTLREAVNCVDSETFCLTDNGWKNYETLTNEDYIVAYDISTKQLKLEKPSIIHVYPNYCGDVIEFKSRCFSAVTSPNHRWAVESYYGRAKRKIQRYVTSSSIDLYGGDKIYRTGDYYREDNKDYSDDDLKLFGWVLTDGYYKTASIGKKTYTIGVCQSLRANPEKVKEIDVLLESLHIKTYRRFVERTECIYWEFSAGPAKNIRNIFPNKELTYEFIMSLSKRQSTILMNTMLRGDGTVTKGDGITTHDSYTFCAGTKNRTELFQALCILAGKATTCHSVDNSKYKRVSNKLKNIPKAGICWYVQILNRDKIQVVKRQANRRYDMTTLWCPTVSSGAFVAMRKGKIFITGNSPIQGSAWNIMELILIQVDKLLESYDAYLVMQVYDALVVEAREKDIPELSEKIKKVVSNINKPYDRIGDVKILTDIETGYNLAELEKM